MQNYFFTKRLKCREVTQSDIKLLTQWSRSKEANGEYLSAEKMIPEEILVKYKNKSFWNEKSKTYIIETKDTKVPIGMVKYWSKTDSSTTAMMAIKIALPEQRRKGYGTEVQKAMIRELFKKYNYEIVEMYTDINNIPQKKCLEKLDFEEIKVESYIDAGVPRQGHLYRLTKERYEKSGVHIFYYE